MTLVTSSREALWPRLWYVQGMNLFSILLGAGFGLALGHWWGLRESRRQAATGQEREKALLERAVRSESEAAHAQAALSSDQQRLDKLKAEFSDLAGRLLEEKSGKLREEAGSQFGVLLAPLKQNLEDLKGLADRIHRDDVAQRASLETTVKALAEAHSSFSLQARDLSLSLKGNVRSQGKWGEVILERVLESSGLRAGQEYVLQGKGLELKGPGGESQKPDAIVMLPEGKHLVIDAKTSLDGYDAWVAAGDEAGRELAAQQQVLALRKQVKDLGEKAYYLNDKLAAVEFTVMFVPSEPALGLALQREPGLFDQAWQKRIVVVGPNTLFGTLKVVAQLWGQERRNKNAEKIAEEGGKLYDKFVAFLEDLSLASKAQESALNQLNEAKRKLVDGPGNLVRKAEELARLGAKTSKKIREEVVTRAEQGP